MMMENMVHLKQYMTLKMNDQVLQIMTTFNSLIYKLEILRSDSMWPQVYKWYNRQTTHELIFFQLFGTSLRRVFLTSIKYWKKQNNELSLILKCHNLILISKCLWNPKNNRHDATIFKDFLVEFLMRSIWWPVILNRWCIYPTLLPWQLTSLSSRFHCQYEWTRSLIEVEISQVRIFHTGSVIETLFPEPNYTFHSKSIFPSYLSPWHCLVIDGWTPQDFTHFLTMIL